MTKQLWHPTVVVATSLVAAIVLLSATVVLGGAAATAPKPRCRHAVSSAAHAGDDGTTRRLRRDADGILRTPGDGCSADGLACSMCCNGTCCEDLAGTNGSVFADQHWIPVHFAFVSSSAASFNDAATHGRIENNLKTMNRVFGPSNLWFYSGGATHHSDPRMVAACDTNQCDPADPSSCDFLSYLMPRVKNDTSRSIPVVLCDGLPYLGEAQVPWTAVEDSPEHYVQLDASTLGADNPAYPGGLGYTLVHEMGHYFGLLHVFEPTCSYNGDWVNDTASARTAATEETLCDAVLDSCPGQPGNDPIDNYMNYAADECMTRFTAGQWTRMRQALRRYRPLLLQNTAAPTGACPTTSASLSDCTCGNGNAPAKRCQAESAAATTAAAVPSTVTTTAATTPTTAAATPSAALTQSQTLLGGTLTMRWAPWTAGSASLELELVSTAPDKYVGFGVASAAMAGHIVTCAVGAVDGAVQCSEWAAGSYSIGTRATTNAVQAVSGSRTAAQLTIRLTLSASALGIAAGGQRVIYAVGAYNAGTNAPSRHASSADRAGSTIDFGAQAAVTTDAALPATTTTTNAPAGNIPVSGAAKITTRRFSMLGGAFGLAWQVFAPAATPSSSSTADVIEFSIDTEVGADRYVAIGMAAEQMSGHIVVCAVGIAPTCRDFTGSGLALSPAATTSASVVAVATVSNGPNAAGSSGTARRLAQAAATTTTTTTAFTVRIRADALGVSAGRQRMITATGAYDFGSGWPSQHAPGDRAFTVVDINAGTASSDETVDGFLVAFIVTLCACALALLLAAGLNVANIVLGPTASLAASVAAVVIFVGLVGLVWGMRLEDHTANLKAWPEARAFGDAAVFCLWFVLYPVPKNNLVAKITGSSYERLLPYHMLVAVVLFLVATAHFVIMAIKLDASGLSIFAASDDAGDHPPLFGFLTWLSLTIIVVPSVVLRRRWYWVLKLAHLAAPLVILFGVLHYNPLLFALIPPLLAYVVDVVLRFRSSAMAKPQLVHVKHNAPGGFTELEIKLAPGAVPAGAPGAFVHLGLSTIGSRLHPHPFSVAWFDAQAHTATLICKDMGAGTWTGDLALAARNDPAALLARTDVQWTGPYGSLQVPLGSTPVVVLVAGGIGVTPILNILRVIRRDSVAARRGGATAITNVLVLWSLRSTELLDATKDKWESVWGGGDDDGHDQNAFDAADELLGPGPLRRHPETEEDSNGGGGGGGGDSPAATSLLTFGRDPSMAASPLLVMPSAAAPAASASKPPQTGAAAASSLLGPAVQGTLFGSKLNGVSARQARPFQEVQPRRVTIGDDVPAMLAAIGRRDAAITLYCCGPSELMDAAATFARSRSGDRTTLLHTETFEL